VIIGCLSYLFNYSIMASRKNKTANKILIGVSIDALGAARFPQVMATAGCEVTVVCGRGLAVTSSRFVKEHIKTGRSPREVRLGLESHVAQYPDRYSWVIIADEPLLRTFLDSPAIPPLARLAPLTANPERLAHFLSKVSFSQDAQEAGIPVPRFRVLAEEDDLPRGTWRGTPTVAKAEESLSGSGVRIIHSAEELADVNATMTARPMLFQEYKTGQVGATAALFDHGKPKCWFSYLLRRNWPNPLASASALEMYWHPEIEATLVRLGEMTEFHGFCGLDWVLDESTGTPFILEMNPRPTPGLYVSHLAGVNFSAAIADWLEGGDSVQRPSETASGMHRMFPQNLFRSIDDHDAVEFFQTFADAPWTDPKLLLSYMRRVLTHYLPQSWRHTLKRAMTAK
jgi:predicted ATP-grasp superfamily ATP-dependent carboligase